MCSDCAWMLVIPLFSHLKYHPHTPPFGCYTSTLYVGVSHSSHCVLNLTEKLKVPIGYSYRHRVEYVDEDVSEWLSAIF